MKALIVDDERLARTELKRLLNPFKEIKVVGEAINAEAMEYLSHHSIQATPILASGHPKEAIIEAASAQQNSIVIMGAYGDTRLREILLGSTTEAVITKTDCPVLLYR